MLFEPIKRVVVQHLAPKISVITGRVATVPDVRKIGRVITRRHLRYVDLKTLKRLRLEFVCVLLWRIRWERVPGHVEQRGGHVFRGRVTLIEGA